MKTMNERLKIQNLLLLKALSSTSAIIVIFLKLFLPEIDEFYLLLTVGISILILPLVNFSLIYLGIKTYYKNTSIISFTTISSAITLFTALMVMIVTSMLISEITSKIELFVLFLTLVFLFEIPLSLSFFPFFPVQNRREEISKQILISSFLISLSLISMVAVTQYTKKFSIIEEIIMIIIVTLLLLVSLVKSYNNLYKDIEILKELISLQLNRKEEITTKELYQSMSSLEKIITNQYSSTVGIIKSINEIRKNLSQMDKEILEIISKIRKSKQKIYTIKNSIEENMKIVENTEKIVKTTKQSLSDYLRDISKLVETIKTFEPTTVKTIDTIRFHLGKISEIKTPLETSMKNMKKSNEMLLATIKIVPEVIENLHMFNNTIKELRKISTKINSTRVSFDVELRKSNLDKQNRDKLGVISKKIDELFLSLQESVNSISFDEESFSIEETLKTMSLKTKQIQNTTEKFYTELQRLETTMTTIKFSLENAQNNSLEISENLKEIEYKINNIIETLKRHETTIVDIMKKLEETKSKIEGILTEYEDIENLLSKHRDSISSVMIKIPKFIEEIYTG